MVDYPRSPIPDVALVKRHFSTERIEDVPAVVREQLRKADLASRIKPGQRIAITAGSRGVSHIAQVIATIVQEIQRLDARPFIVPAMGSHGGATAEGQVELIAEYGITEEKMGCPILSSMETVEVGRIPEGIPVYMDRNAHDADGVILVGRVKNHTSFRAPIESGLCKMIGIGLGKQRGAETLHARGMRHLGQILPDVASTVIATGKIVLGVALVENAYHQTCRIVAAPPERIQETDRELLVVAHDLMPLVPFDKLDVLVVDWMGKNISGAGMDSNVVGMWRATFDPPCAPLYTSVVVLNVTPESHGNCTGVGAADFTTRKLADQFDRTKTNWNCLTSASPLGARIPCVLDTDVEAVEVALKCSMAEGREYELVRIKDTLELDKFWVSAPLLEQLQGNPEYELLRGLGPMPRDGEGNLLWA